MTDDKGRGNGLEIRREKKGEPKKTAGRRRGGRGEPTASFSLAIFREGGKLGKRKAGRDQS